MVIRSSEYIIENVIHSDDVESTESSVYLGVSMIKKISPQKGSVIDGERDIHNVEFIQIKPRNRENHRKRAKNIPDSLLRGSGWKRESKEKFYYLPEGTYFLEVDEDISISEGDVGIIKTPLELLKSSATIKAPIVHPKSSVNVTLNVSENLLLSEDCTVAELFVAKSDGEIDVWNQL